MPYRTDSGHNPTTASLKKPLLSICSTKRKISTEIILQNLVLACFYKKNDCYSPCAFLGGRAFLILLQRMLLVFAAKKLTCSFLSPHCIFHLPFSSLHKCMATDPCCNQLALWTLPTPVGFGAILSTCFPMPFCHPHHYCIRHTQRFVVSVITEDADNEGEDMRLSPVDIAVLFMYTLESDIYRVCNRVMRNGEAEGIQTWRPFIYYLDKALDLIPTAGAELYRGIAIPFDLKKYDVGKVVEWGSFTSASADKEVASSFLKGEFGLLFVLKQQDGRSISKYSFYPEEVLPSPTQRVQLMYFSGTRLVCVCMCECICLYMCMFRYCLPAHGSNCSVGLC